MVKTPRTRHSKTSREPVTIDLEAESVKRDSDADEAAPAAETAAPDPNEAPPPADEPARVEDGEPLASTEHEADAAPAEKTTDEQASEFPQENAPREAEPTAGTPSAHAQRRSSGGVGGAFVAGLLGGLIALVAGGALLWAGVLPLPDGNAGDPAVEGLRQEVAAVEQELSRMREAGTAGPSMEALEQALAEPRQQISELRDTVSALQSASPQGESGEVQALRQQLADLEQRIASIADAGNGGELRTQIEEIEGRIDSAEQAAEAAGQAAEAAAQRLNNLAQQVAQLGDQVGTLSNQVATLGEEVARADEGPRLALLVAANALRSAVDRGLPFAGELETFSALAPNAPELEPLRPYAETGIATRAELAAQAPEMASRIAALASAPPPDAGLLERLTASARSAVSVRPVGEVEGETPSAIAARMEAAVQNGDYAQALAEYETLPAEAKEAASDFAEKLRARQAADEVLEKALSGALQPA